MSGWDIYTELKNAVAFHDRDLAVLADEEDVDFFHRGGLEPEENTAEFNLDVHVDASRGTWHCDGGVNVSGSRRIGGRRLWETRMTGYGTVRAPPVYFFTPDAENFESARDAVNHVVGLLQLCVEAARGAGRGGGR